ncbi:shikimate kinase [Enterococcus sp. BWT-B8]|uniref:shikimate kinase n=1 Tax=Enterococcus sp. BWT-B8 TaxID=2885157 RepID=UPI001E4B3090|nr:shikimate kinase [Enterococcus sp. BWT-B8]MCB5950634.1 shikimate kinase [Enterococcus sp. BWT-B8]
MQGITLIGFMGAGKTTVGKLLSKSTGMNHIDFDDKIVEEIGMTIQEYFDLYGEDAFREKETTVLKKYIDHGFVISTGGGIVMRPENRELLKQMKPVVYLETAPEVFIPRLKNDHTTVRPLVVSKSPEEIKQVFEPRISFYKESASMIVSTDQRTPEEITEEILTRLKQR